MNDFIKFSGLVNIVSGCLLLGFWYLYAILMPYAELSDTLSILVVNKNWIFVNVLGVAGTLLGMLGLAGIYMRIAEASNLLGIIGFSLSLLGSALLLGTLLWDTVLWPLLVNHDPTLLDFSGPIYSSKTFVPFFIVAGLVYALGYILFGLAISKSGLFPAWSGIMLAVGAPLFGLGAMFGKLQVYPRSIGITAIGIGMIWLGYLMTGLKK